MAARDASRYARSVPAVRRVLERSDPARRVRRLLRAGIIDANLYARQLGVSAITEKEAAEHYVRQGHLEGMTLNALVDNYLLNESIDSQGRPIIYEYVARRDWSIPVSPVWDVRATLRRHPEASAHPGGPVGFLWEAVSKDPSTPIPVHGSMSIGQIPWSDFYKIAGLAIESWTDDRRHHDARQMSLKLGHARRLGREWDASARPPMVSIICATWNRGPAIRNMIDAVRAQSWQNWELIIVDDGSWDDTAAVVTGAAATDPRIRLVEREHAGVSAARNAGIAAANGTYVAFIDSDNAWEPHFLTDMIVAMEADGDDAAFATIEVDHGRLRAFRQTQPDRASLAIANTIDLNTLVVKRSVIEAVGGFDTSLRRAVDYDLILRIADETPIRHIPTVGAVYDNSDSSTDRISATEALGWNNVVRLRHQVDWAELRTRPRVDGISVLQVIERGDRALHGKLDQLAALSRDEDVSIHVAMVAPTRDEWMLASMGALTAPRLQVHNYVNHEPFAFAVDRIMPHVDRNTLVVVGPTLHLDATSIRALAHEAETRQAIVAPLVQNPDGTIGDLGLGWVKGTREPCAILGEHPVEDADALPDAVDVPALGQAVFAARTDVFLDAGGLDPLLWNEFETTALSLDARQLTPPVPSVIMTRIRVRRTADSSVRKKDPSGTLLALTQRTRTMKPTPWNTWYEPLGQHIAALLPLTQEGKAPAGPAWRPVVERNVPATSEGMPRLRWAIKIAAPVGKIGEAWGDTHFARSLADALRRLGQEVVIDFREAHSRSTAYLDDVSLVIRGLDRWEPTTPGLSMVWVISHPELVTAAELRSYDLAFAASTRWAVAATERWGVAVRPLLQCTDAGLFHPGDAEPGDDILFVGKSRDVPRPVVMAPVEAGIDVKVYGPDWSSFLGPDQIAGSYVPNDELSDYYARAGVVLNDHWEDMRREGFISNRVFDVVASGGRVLTDDVEGLDEIFGDAVRTFGSPAQLVGMLQAGFDDWDRAHPAVARRIVEEHSFDARARTLLQSAIEARRGSA
ncbi:glycosyltransferase [Microbacterium sp. zg.Y1090]|uniref:glycosyltransferase n=1 Tax=Microbacterium wangruii TaxID=3049073 RepID=UPI00214C7AF9|nr:MULTISPECIES: glycosyltransferase [unclassified Microbacterium]MCR2818076.1 glycosyltransferase [Microbacterium sp. zg.Y1090]WIM27766.1 glycosyltransferase [Microbacterium sp. zg-Y1090]